MMHMGWAACLSALAACQLVGGIEDTSLFEVDAAAAPQEYGVRGVAGGVQDPVALELRFPGGTELLSVTADGPFAFETSIAEGASYTAVFVGQPPCLLDGATGVLADADAEIGLACNGAATLADITLSGLTAPELELLPGQLAYTAEVSLLQESMSITPVASKADATITIAGQPVASGTASAPLPLDLGDNQIEVVVSHASGLQRTYRITVRRAAALAQYAYGKGANSSANDNVGFSVALSGDTLAVGASGEDSAATGTGGNQDDDTAQDSGAVYVFH
jgi:hypothetical protein